MTEVSPLPTAAAPVDRGQSGLLPPECPLCHLEAPLPLSAIEAGRDWHCSRCGQQWDAKRLKTVAAYAVWSARIASESP
ncbi:MAG: hypothetical protein AB7N65_07740 [Vicinamibacterales bacterium]